MSFELEWEEPWGLSFCFRGPVTPGETARLNLMITSDPRFDDLRYVIADFMVASDHGFFEPDDDDATEMAFVPLLGASHTNARAVFAVVTASPRIRELMLRLRAEGLFPYRFEFFESLDEARDWISAQTLTV